MNKVWIVWGSEEFDQKPTEYSFDTLGELNAFLHGVSEADGWVNWHQLDNQKEVDDYLESMSREESE